LRNNYIEVENHPPYSPDLDAIENIWAKLKRQLHQWYLEISGTKRGKEAVKRDLLKFCHWFEKLFQRNFWRLMADIVAAVIEAKG